MGSIAADILWRGRVDRISGGGNAMIKPTDIQSYASLHEGKHNELNIGPLPDSAVGEQVVFTWDSGAFGLCLEDRFVSESYFDEWYSKSEVSISKSTAKAALVSPNHERSIPEGTICTATPLVEVDQSVTSEKSVMKLIPDDAPENDSGLHLGILDAAVPPARVPRTVKVTGHSDSCPVVEPEPLKATADLPSIGDECIVRTQMTSDTGTMAIYQGSDSVRVVIRDVEYPTGETISVQITNHHDYYLSAEPAFSIDDFEKPVQKSDISLDNSDDLPWTIKDGTPIKIRPLAADIPQPDELLVFESLKSGLLAVWDVRSATTENTDISVGSTIELTIDSVTDGRLVGLYEGFPIVCYIDRPLPQSLEGEHLTVVVQSVAPDRATVHLKTPSFSPETQVLIDPIGQTDSHHFGRAGGHLIRVAETDRITIESTFRVAVESVGEISEASVQALRELVQPQDADQSAYIRLPATVGSKQRVADVPVDTSALPDISEPVTLGIESWASDHVVPSIAGLPDVEIPSVDDIVSVRVGEQTNSPITPGVSNELPFELLGPGTDNLTQTYATVVNQNRNNFLAVATTGSDGNHFHQIVDLTGYAYELLAEGEYESARQVLAKITEIPPNNKFLIKAVLQARYALLAATELFTANPVLGVQSTLQEAHDLISTHDGDHLDDVEVHLLRSYTLQIEAVLKCVEAYTQAQEDTDTSLQAIARGARGTQPIAIAIQKLRESVQTVENTPFEAASPSQELLYFIRRFEAEFPYLLNNLEGWRNTHDSDSNPQIWFERILPDTIPDAESAGSIFEISSESDEPDSLWTRPDFAASVIIDESTFDTPQETPRASTDDSEPSKTLSGDRTGSSSSGDGEVSFPGGKHSSTDDSLPVGYSNPSAGSTDTDQAEEGSDGGPTTEPEASTDATGSDTDGRSQPDYLTNITLSDGSPHLRRLRRAAEADATETPVKASTSTSSGSQYQRSQKIRDYALARADGHCEACGETAPFTKPNGDPFLEVHHVDELGDGGADHPDLVVAVCPNCHREIHYGSDGDQLNEALRERLEQGSGSIDGS